MMTNTNSPPILSTLGALNALTGNDNQLRYYAAWWLGKHQIQEACPVLCDCLRDEGYRTAEGGYPLRRQVARTLGILKNPMAVPALLSALTVTEDPQLQEASIQALTAIDDRSCIPVLMKLLESSKVQPYQEALIESLGHFLVREARDLIEPFLQNPSERLQCAAARYFYQITKESSYLDRIIRNLDHHNPYVRWSAAFDLGAIGDIDAVQAIIKAPIANSLKLLNLKRILEALLRQTEDDFSSINGQNRQILFDAIDQLLIQL